MRERLATSVHTTEHTSFMIATAMERLGRPVRVGEEENGKFPVYVRDKKSLELFSNLHLAPELEAIFDALDGSNVREKFLMRTAWSKKQKEKIKALALYRRAAVLAQCGPMEHNRASQLEKEARKLLGRRGTMLSMEDIQKLVNKAVRRRLRKK